MLSNLSKPFLLKQFWTLLSIALLFCMPKQIIAKENPMIHIIANSSVEASSISTYTLSRIYAMQIKNWVNGNPIRVFILPENSPSHRLFVIHQLNMQTHQLDRLWKRMVFTGTGRGPTIVNSEQEMIDKVSSTPGAIGYIEHNIDAAGIKYLRVGDNNEK